MEEGDQEMGAEEEEEEIRVAHKWMTWVRSIHFNSRVPALTLTVLAAAGSVRYTSTDFFGVEE
jgi:hypothetical protein